MSFSQLVAKPRPIILLPLLAVLAVALTFSLVSSAKAPAASGGLGAGGTALADSEPKQSKKKKKARKGAAKYNRLWKQVSRRNKRWARRTAECESGRNPRAIGGGGLYRGAFQFMKPTWRSSPRSPGGDPIRYSYRTQAVVAVALKKRDGAGHWPHCG